MMSHIQISAVCAEGVRLLEQRNYAEAIKFLKLHTPEQPDGEFCALLALAHFQREEYDLAVTNYEAALERDPDNTDWRETLQLAKSNAVAEVHVPVPDFYFFDREKLLAKPIVPEGALPPPMSPALVPGLIERLRILLGNALGTIFTIVMDGLTQLWGKLVGYRDEVWTNWYRKPLAFGILSLAYMREQLNKYNLRNTYPSDALIGFQPEGQTPPQGTIHFRTADGSWNNLCNPMEGAAGTRFLRNVKIEAIRPETGDTLMSPNPREISRILLAREGEMKEVPFLNLLAASWIQFQNHDWINHGEVLHNDFYEIPLAEDDPARKKFWQTRMFVGRTQTDPTRSVDNEETPITFINEVTHWWDGSQIYGSDQETVDHLRCGVDGKLRLNADGTLPCDGKGIEETGFVRNWWLGLAMLHTLFAREHNAIASHLKEAHPDWNDNRLFNVARLINAACMAKIHSVEWTPAILPNRGLNAALNANWYGILTNLLRVAKNRKTVANINVRNPEMGGVVGNPIDKHGQPFGLTEEFVEVYRLHSLLPETLKFRKIRASDGIEEIPFSESRQAGSAKLAQRMEMADFFHRHPTGCGETPFRAGLKKGGRRRIPTKESAV